MFNKLDIFALPNVQVKKIEAADSYAAKSVDATTLHATCVQRLGRSDDSLEEITQFNRDIKVYVYICINAL